MFQKKYNLFDFLPSDDEIKEYELRRIWVNRWRGQELLKPGYIYAPYIPITETPLILEPESFHPSKKISSKFSKRMINQKFYRELSHGTNEA